MNDTVSCRMSSYLHCHEWRFRHCKFPRMTRPCHACGEPPSLALPVGHSALSPRLAAHVHKQRRTPVAGFIAHDILRQYIDGLLKG